MNNLNYKIQDWFQHDKFEVIVSIASPDLDKLSNDEIKNLISDRLIIQDSDSYTKKCVKVSKIKIASSIIDKKNVSICLGNSIELSDIKPNSDIVLTTQKEITLIKNENQQIYI